MCKTPSIVRRVLLLLVSSIVILSSTLLASVDLPVKPAAPAVIHLGVFDYLGAARTEEEYAPLVDYLNRVLTNEQIQLHVLTQAELNHRMSQRTIDLVITNPTHYLEARAHYPLTGAIATQVRLHEDTPVYWLGGAILTLSSRQDINRLQDLRGQVVAARSRYNLGGYRAQAYELYLAGVRVPDALAELIETGTHESAIFAVMEGRADVAFVRDGIFEQMLNEGVVPAGALKLINAQLSADFPHHVSTRLYPEWPVFALRHLDDNAIRRVAAALFSLEPEQAKANHIGIGGFTVPADYVEVEQLTRALRLPPYDQLPDFTFSDVWLRWQALILPAAVGLLFILLLSLLLVWHWGKVQLERNRFVTLLQGLGEGVYGVDRKGTCTFINDAAIRMLQTSLSQVLGRDQHRLFHHHYQDGRTYSIENCPITKTLSDGRKRQSRDWFIRHDGTGFPVDLMVTPLFTRSEISGAVVAFSDVTLRNQAEEENKRLTQYNRLLLESVGDGIYGCDMQGRCTFINPAALEMLGLAYEDVIGLDQHMIFHYRRLNGSVYPHEECPVHEVLVSGESKQCEDHFVHSSGTTFPVSMTVTPMLEGEVQVGVVVVFQDVSQQKEMQAKLITLTTTDDLTGLYNRRYFQTQLHQEFARFQRSFADTALLMIDLDHFKQINDRFGHAAGDRVLQDFARLLKKAQRNSDLSARVGGEEFAMLLPDTGLEDACALANRLREQITAFSFIFEQHTIDVTVSIGCTLMLPEDERPDTALARADRALYEAKAAGRNRVVADA